MQPQQFIRVNAPIKLLSTRPALGELMQPKRRSNLDTQSSTFNPPSTGRADATNEMIDRSETEMILSTRPALGELMQLPSPEPLP